MSKIYFVYANARARGAIGSFENMTVKADLPDGYSTSDIVDALPELELRGATVLCPADSDCDFPSPEGKVVAYQLINDVADAFSCGFIRAGDMRNAKRHIDRVYRPCLKAWTANQLRRFAENNYINLLK